MKKTLEVKKHKKINVLNIFVIFIIVIFLLNFLTIKSDRLFEIIGYRSYSVLSGSMEPTFYPGDVVIVKHKNKTDIQVNDVVTYRDNEGIVITHRIIEETAEGYITQGDNNNVEDTGILIEDNIIGEVKLSIPKVGYITEFLSKPIIIAAEMILLAVFLFFYAKDDHKNEDKELF